MFAQLNGSKYCYVSQTIQLNISHLFAHSSNWPIDRILSDVTAPSQCGPGSNGNEGVFHTFQNSMTEAWSPDCLVSYPGYLLEWRGGCPLCRLGSHHLGNLHNFRKSDPNCKMKSIQHFKNLVLCLVEYQPSWVI